MTEAWLAVVVKQPANHCLIPMSAFAEVGPSGQVTRTWISIADQPLAGCADLWRPTDEWGDSYTMVSGSGRGSGGTGHAVSGRSAGRGTHGRALGAKSDAGAGSAALAAAASILHGRDARGVAKLRVSVGTPTTWPGGLGQIVAAQNFETPERAVFRAVSMSKKGSMLNEWGMGVLIIAPSRPRSNKILAFSGFRHRRSRCAPSCADNPTEMAQTAAANLSASSRPTLRRVDGLARTNRAGVRWK